MTAVLKPYCVECRPYSPGCGAPQPLVSYANLTAKATTDSTETVGALPVKFLKSGVMTPKPSAAPSASELTAFKSWVTSGMPKPTCTQTADADGAMSPYGAMSPKRDAAAQRAARC
jgi:hypothetical protein